MLGREGVVLTLAIGFMANSEGTAWTRASNVISRNKVSLLGDILDAGRALALLVAGIIVVTTGAFTVMVVRGVISACAAIAYAVWVYKPITGMEMGAL